MRYVDVLKLSQSDARPRRSATGIATMAGVLIAVLLVGCAREESVVGLELELLVEQQDTFLGRLVRTSGTVRMHDSPRHFWLEDDARNRVGLVPAQSVEAWLGEEVEIVGRFGFAADTGRTIQVQQVRRQDHGDEEHENIEREIDGHEVGEQR